MRISKAEVLAMGLQPTLAFGLDRGEGLPEFVRTPHGIKRRCGCGRDFADPIGCQGRCPEALYDESTGLCLYCIRSQHLQKGAIVKAPQ